MATSTVTPPASAPAAAPSTSSPASAPSSSTPSTPAPATPVSTTVETPSTEPKSMADKLAEGWTAAKAAVEADQTAEEVPVVEPAAVVPATEEEITATPVVEPEKTEEEKTAAAATEEVPKLDDGQSLSPQDFAKELTTDPATKKFFDERPDIKNRVFAALRRDAKNLEIQQYVPDLETAKMVTKAASTFQAIDNKFLGATTKEGAQEFLNTWVREAMIVGDDGKPLMDDGKYQLHPALTYTFDHIFGNKLSVLEQKAKDSGNERLQAAVDVIKEVMSPSSSAQGEIPDELKPYADSLKAEREAFDNEKATAARQQQEQRDAINRQSIGQAETKSVESVNGQLKPLFSKAGLTDFEQTAALREIGDAIDGALGFKQPDGSWTQGSAPVSWLFQSEYDRLTSQPPSDARDKSLTKLILTHTNQILGPIASKVILQAKGGALTRQTDKQTKVATQTTASRTEPAGASINSPSTAGQTPAQIRAQVVKDLTAKNGGNEPDSASVMAELWKRMPR